MLSFARRYTPLFRANAFLYSHENWFQWPSFVLEEKRVWCCWTASSFDPHYCMHEPDRCGACINPNKGRCCGCLILLYWGRVWLPSAFWRQHIPIISARCPIIRQSFNWFFNGSSSSPENFSYSIGLILALSYPKLILNHCLIMYLLHRLG